MSKIYCLKAVFITICLVWLFQADPCLAEGYFRLVLTDGTIVEGEMIRITPATIEINPEGPEEFASYNRSRISDVVYMSSRPEKKAVPKSAPEPELKAAQQGILVVRFNFEGDNMSDETPELVHDYVLIDSLLYFAGRFDNFLIELPAGWHSLEFCGDSIAYLEPTYFYHLHDGGNAVRIWRQAEPYIFGKTINIDIRGDKATSITLDRLNENSLFISDKDSRVKSREEMLSDQPDTLKWLRAENGIIPGKLIFEKLPDDFVYHDSLVFRYRVVFNESDWARFNDSAYLPGNYLIEARALAWNNWRNKLTGETVTRCQAEIRSGHTTVVKFDACLDSLDCRVTILPDKWFEISTRESKE